MLPIYKRSGAQLDIFRQADAMHFLQGVSQQLAAARTGPRAAAPLRMVALQQLFHPSAAALLAGGSATSGQAGVGAAAAAAELELVVCGMPPELREEPDPAGGAPELRIVAPAQPEAHTVLGMLLNAGGGGGEVAGSLRAMVASGADLQDQASVSATFGPTGRVVTIGVQRIRGSAQGQGEGLAVYRLRTSADSAPVLALLHAAIAERALRLDGLRGWQALSVAAAQRPELSASLSELLGRQMSLLREQQAAASTAGAGAALEYRRIATALRGAQDQGGPLRRAHDEMRDAETLRALSAQLRAQTESLAEMWIAPRRVVNA